MSPEVNARYTPTMRLLLERMARAPYPPLHTLSARAAKEAYEKSAGVLEVPKPELARVHDLFPALALEIEVDNTPPMRNHLLAHRIDLAFLLGPLSEAEVENLDLCRYPLAWLASPQLDLGTGPLTLESLAQWPIVTYPASSRPHQAVRQMLASAGLQNVRMVGSASLSTTVRMVQAGMGVGVFSPAVLRRELAEGQLRMLEVDGAPLPDLDFTASWRRGRDSHVAAAVARLAVQVAASSGTDSKF